MKNSIKIPAFTLMELVVVMAIGGIVMLIGAGAWEVSSRQLHQFKVNSETLLSTSRLNNLLCRDFERAAAVRKTPGGLEFQMGNSIISYEIGSENVVRIMTGLTDTFRLNIYDASTKWQGRQAQLLVDEYSFTGTIGSESLPFHFSKTYAADQIISSNQNK